ncbi:MAG: hypothetical protein OHK0039_26380 [Bacteroidia bacterium]
MKTIRIPYTTILICLASLLPAAAWGQLTFDPDTACVGDTITISRTNSNDNLTVVDTLRLFNGSNNRQVDVFAQTLTSVKFIVPAGLTHTNDVNTFNVELFDNFPVPDTIVATGSFVIGRPVNEDLGSDRTICIGSSTTLASSNPSGNFSYAWTPSTGLSATNVASVSASPSTSTNYTLVTTNTVSGCSDNDVINVAVRALPTLDTLQITDPTCPGENDGVVRVVASGTTDTQWRIGNTGGWTNSGVALTGLSPQLNSDLQIEYRSVPRCNIVIADTIDLVDKTLPAAAINTNVEEVCQGESVSIFSNSVSGATYAWTFGSGSTPSTGTGLGPFNVVYTNTGSPTIGLTMIVQGCTVTNSASVQVNALPNISNVTSSSPSDCGGDDGSILVTIGSPTNFEYRLEGAKVVDWQQSNTFGNLAQGTYTVRVRNETTGCERVWPDPVIVSDPSDLAAAISIDQSLICAGEAVEIGTETQTGVSFSWNFGSGATPATATGPGPHTVRYASDGSKDIVLSLQEGNCTASETDGLEVLPIPTIELDPTPPTLISSGDSLLIDISSPVEGATFTWEVETTGELVDGPDSTGSGDRIAAYFEQGGSSTVEVLYTLVSDAAGCGDTLGFSFVVGPPMAFIPDLFTPNGDGYNDTWEIRLPGNLDPEDHVLRVFNRAGAVVHEDDLSRDWDGRADRGANLVPEGAYWFVIYPAKDPQSILYSGGVTLLR